ncbi:hypothetical protein HMPREF0765_1470 [Sphingobacterium spiritivorum ATCC 33300]|uniref:Uncharacterized protein n=1 Tax=Sphingobacterium spiritivorum ATCC 33300 TaxID=525372 RepID=C2FVW4_SPHSI|nr:hypothetical protein [Sphingobacterium spiritivorum]EEI92956.1 hypothetical protein HMPREF0765_1470 [Sphingobacterium spiritivorum ATCC 33300]QQS96303.1 hypothetical protein I6J03_00915 [Sphingobacterium spiritivorum]
MSGQNLEIKITISNNELRSIQEDPQQLITHISSENWEALKSGIVDQLADRDGAPQLDQIRIQNFRWDENSRKGSFRMQFLINRHFCCSDTEACAMDYVDWNFVYNAGLLSADANYVNWTLDN